jgi:hypothetical protein
MYLLEELKMGNGYNFSSQTALNYTLLFSITALRYDIYELFGVEKIESNI